MLGISNSQGIASNFYNMDDNLHELTFTAGEEINAGDFVKVMSRDAFSVMPLQVGDSGADRLGGMTLPLAANPQDAEHSQWMQCFSVTQAWSGARLMYSLRWPRNMLPSQMTWANIVNPTSGIGGGPEIQLSEIAGSCWGEAMDIGDGYWLLPAMGSNTASAIGKDGITRAYPSQILLCRVNPEDGKAQRCVSFKEDGTENASGGVDYTSGNINASQYGPPIICKLSPREYVMIYEALVSGVYQLMARYFTVKKIADSYEVITIPENAVSVRVDEVTTVDGDILKNFLRPVVNGIEQALYDPATDEWKIPTYSKYGEVKFKEQELSIYYQSSLFFFYGHCCNFTNTETREIYTLTNSQVNYVRIHVDEEGILRNNPERYVLNPVLAPEFKKFSGLYTSYTQMPMSFQYYNQLGVYNKVRCSDNKTSLYVHPHFYFKFVIDYDTHVIDCTLHPLWAKNTNAQRMINPQTQDWNSDHTRYNRDVERTNCRFNSGYCTGVNNGAANNMPYLYPMSKNRFLMCYTAETTHQYSNSNSPRQRSNVTVLLDFNDELGTLELTSTYGMASWANGTTWPESNYMNPRVFLDLNDNIVMFQSRWIGSNNWCPWGQISYSSDSIGNSVKELRAWRANSDSTYTVENDLQRAVYSGVAMNHADAGKSVKIKTTLQKQFIAKEIN